MLVEFIVVSLAVWRLSSLLVDEEGPFDVFVRLRKFVGVKYDEHSQPYGSTFIANLLTCVWCVSVWVGAIAAVCMIISVKFTFYLALPFALSAVAIIVEEVILAYKRG